MSATDVLLANNAAFAQSFEPADLVAAPAKKVVVLACMDARLDPARFLGLDDGDAHVIRNAGGAATSDAIRSIVISQRLLGTEEIMLVHHTGCGMQTFTDDALKDAIADETGIRPDFSFETFSNVEQDVRQTAARLMASPFVPHKNIRGFVYLVETGELREVGLS